MSTASKKVAIAATAVAALVATTALAAQLSGTWEDVEGWDYSILDSTSESWLKVNYGARSGMKTLVPYLWNNYSGVKGADGSRTADVDGDGDTDVMTVYEEDKALYVYENTWGRDHYNAVARQKVGLGCGQSEEAIFFDFDGNGYPDIMCVATAGGNGVTGERLYAYRNLRPMGDCAKMDGAISPCWSPRPEEFGSGVPQKNWYRIGGDNGSIDLNHDNCPDIAIGSAGGDIGVLWCPPATRRNPSTWIYSKVWGVSDAEIQKIMMVTHGGANWLVWSAKMPNKGVYAARYQSGIGASATFGPVQRIVSDVYSMEFTIANVDADGVPDLVLPTREDVAGMGVVRVYFGNSTVAAPWLGQGYMRLDPPWEHVNCNGLRNENIVKGAAVGDVWGGSEPDIVIMGRGCPYAANGFFYYANRVGGSGPQRNRGNYVWRPLTNQTKAIYQDDEEQKWDPPQLVDIDRDGDLDVVSADENGDWGDTFKNGVNATAKGSDPHDDGVGTLVFWNPRR